VVEHDGDTMRAADHIVDFGPGPGVRGGHVVAAGKFAEVVANPASLTGQYLAGSKQIAIPGKRRPRSTKSLQIQGARHNNLKNIDVEIPLGLFVCITGVSGSGKSSLINDILLEGLLDRYGFRAKQSEEEADASEQGNRRLIGAHDRILGSEQIDKVIDIDQAPIGRTPRSNPATYIKVFDEIRALFAQLPEAKIRGYSPGRFSFNKPGGRCEACEGNGSNRLEMDFLADVWVTCPVCEGHRFNRETLQIRFKLARELCRRSTGKTLYVLDEPTTGLHFADIHKLLQVLHGFVEAGNTVVVIEHNLDVLKTADWIIDLGPEGGAEGGHVVCTGTPEQVAATAASYT